MTQTEETCTTASRDKNAQGAARSRAPLWAALMFAAGIGTGVALRPASAQADDTLRDTLLTEILQELGEIRYLLQQNAAVLDPGE